METVFEMENLVVGYNSRAILKQINFSISRRDITVILGKSGSGKTTILKTIIGLVPPVSGAIYSFGEKIDYFSEKSLQKLRHQIGVLFQNSALLNSFNLYDNISLPLRIRFQGLQKAIEKEMVFARLSQVDLQNDWDKFPHELSGGMKKRAALARALILDPEIIFCDEPSAGLDPITAFELDELLLKLRNLFGITFVVVTHELRSIEKIADNVMILRDNEVYFSGPFYEIFKLNDPFINTFFLRNKKNG